MINEEINDKSFTSIHKIEVKKSDVLHTVSQLLTDICEESPQEIDHNTLRIIKPFISKKIPQISIEDFMKRLLKYSKMESSTLILILIYIDRVCFFGKFQLNYYNIHKLILASMVVSIKYNEDDYFSNKFYAKVGGVTKEELDKLEYEFLSLIDFSLFVDEDLFSKYYDYIKTFNSQNLIDDEEENTTSIDTVDK
jgi:hypothetical protein